MYYKPKNKKQKNKNKMKKKLTKEKREKNERIPVINTIYIDVANHGETIVGRRSGEGEKKGRGKEKIVKKQEEWM